MATTTIYPYGQPGTALAGLGFVLVNTLPTASANTNGAVYLVPNQSDANIKDMYVTVQSGNTYSWSKIGTTQMTVEGYATEEWVRSRDVDLTVAEYQALVNANQVDPDKRYFVDEEQ